MVFLSRVMNVCTSKQQRAIDFIHKRAQWFHTLGPALNRNRRSRLTEKLLMRTADGKSKTGSRAVSSVFLLQTNYLEPIK